jgi:hypothetical protein
MPDSTKSILMQELIPTIDNITKYGLHANLNIEDKENALEKDLVKIYSLFFQIDFNFDNTDYPDFDKTILPIIPQNVRSNFPPFGFYKTILDIKDFTNSKDSALGDAIDDLSDIIRDLLEIKWRIENNSLEDGLWFFQFIFLAHTQQHMLDLLNYMKQMNR